MPLACLGFPKAKGFIRHSEGPEVDKLLQK